MLHYSTWQIISWRSTWLIVLGFLGTVRLNARAREKLRNGSFPSEELRTIPCHFRGSLLFHNHWNLHFVNGQAAAGILHEVHSSLFSLKVDTEEELFSKYLHGQLYQKMEEVLALNAKTECSLILHFTQQDFPFPIYNANASSIKVVACINGLVLQWHKLSILALVIGWHQPKFDIIPCAAEFHT